MQPYMHLPPSLYAPLYAPLYAIPICRWGVAGEKILGGKADGGVLERTTGLPSPLDMSKADELADWRTGGLADWRTGGLEGGWGGRGSWKRFSGMCVFHL